MIDGAVTALTESMEAWAGGHLYAQEKGLGRCRVYSADVPLSTVRHHHDADLKIHRAKVRLMQYARRASTP